MIAAIAALLLATAQQPATPPSAAAPAPAPAAVSAKLVRVALTTGEGPITLELDATNAPLTTANFLRYVDGKRLDGATFYRAMKLGEGIGLVQGGARNDPKRLLPPVAHEPTTKTGLKHVDGAISMAMDRPGSATADFFIVVGDLTSLDANPAKGDPGFAVFGRVTEGMDVVRRILVAPTSPTEGAGVMKGQMLAPTVRIVSARRVAN